MVGGQIDDTRGDPLFAWLAATADLPHLHYLVQRKLNQFGGDLRESLANTPAEVRSVLATMGDAAHQLMVVLPTDDSSGDSTSTATYASRPVSRYQLGKLHAAGGIGEIWLARDADLRREVAVKRLRAQAATSRIAKQRFLREARITGQLEHPGVVPIYEICYDNTTGEPYYAMRFLKGRTLADAVAEYHARRKNTSGDSHVLLSLLNAFCIVCNTVAYAHSKGIVHRDLKSENVILGDYGEVVVIDWGLAKEVGTSELVDDQVEIPSAVATANPMTTLAGQVLGSPAYMAPEQAAGRLYLIGPATDVYGLSAILYEILSGHPPFMGGNLAEVLHRVQHEAPSPPSERNRAVPAALERICLQGLEKTPSRRHASAEILAEAVQGWISDLAVRRQAEEERERFFGLSLDLLAIVDASGQLRQVSPAWQQLLGFAPDELLSKNIGEVVVAADRELMQTRLSTALAHPQVDGFETRMLQKDGGYLWISWNMTPLAQEQSVYLVGRDITELKRSQQLFAGVLQSAPDGMVIINPHGKIDLVNKQIEVLFGYSADELIGQPIEILVPERFRQQHPANVAKFFANGSVRPMGNGLPLRGRRKDGSEFAADIALSPISLESGHLVVASVRSLANRDNSGLGNT